ncbi:repeat 16-like isoform X2 [Octopus vulgaris]|uniref:Repeat 16-like isoform X2 n=1 Tax=Octopus vulgaris TaxID=6645 RepID=A0AA36ARW4_OCTVU|nr:repeat 16-like isoform X2 [Octopus vulgaris]
MNCEAEAWATLNSLIYEYPDNLDLIVMKARLRQLSGEYSLAFYDLKNIAEYEDGANARAMLEAIRNKAEEYWQVAIKLNMRQDFYPAIKKIHLAIKLWPAQAKFYFLRGILYRHINEFTLSIDDLIEALQKSTPEEKETYASDAEKQLLLTFNDFSVECFTNGYFDDAIKLLNKAISVEKMQKGLYLNRAECFFQKGDYNFALQDYEQALELDPLDRKHFPRISELCYLLALQYYTDRNFEESVVKLDKAISYSPITGQLYILRAKCKRMLQDLSGARHDILLGFHLMPTSKDILPAFGYLFPSIPTRNILTSPLAAQTRVIAEELLSDPLHQSIERIFSFDAGESNVLTSLISDPLTVMGNQPPIFLQPNFCSTPDLLQEKKRELRVLPFSSSCTRRFNPL